MIYPYLRQFKTTKQDIDDVPPLDNCFLPVSDGELHRAEQALERDFSSDIRAFYREVGYGFLVRGIHGEVARETNGIVHPSIAVRLAKELDEDIGIREGDLPVFEAAPRFFFVMRPATKTPNALFVAGFDVFLEASLSNFIRRLYFESPNFYWDLI